MKFVKSKTIGFILAVSLFTVPVVTNAKDLIISNATSYDLAFSVNGVCSPELGTVYGYNVKFISEANLQKICGSNSECVVAANKYTCSGESAGGLTFHAGDKGVTVNGCENQCIGNALSVGENKINVFFMENRSAQCLTKNKI